MSSINRCLSGVISSVLQIGMRLTWNNRPSSLEEPSRPATLKPPAAVAAQHQIPRSGLVQRTFRTLPVSAAMPSAGVAATAASTATPAGRRRAITGGLRSGSRSRALLHDRRRHLHGAGLTARSPKGVGAASASVIDGRQVRPLLLGCRTLGTAETVPAGAGRVASCARARLGVPRLCSGSAAGLARFAETPPPRAGRRRLSAATLRCLPSSGYAASWRTGAENGPYGGLLLVERRTLRRRR